MSRPRRIDGEGLSLVQVGSNVLSLDKALSPTLRLEDETKADTLVR